jgi:hypothetical protein
MFARFFAAEKLPAYNALAQAHRIRREVAIGENHDK